MQSTSSVPPPYERITPFLAKETHEGRCYISGKPINSNDQVIMIPVDRGEKRCPAKLSAMFEAMGITSKDEQGLFCQKFVASTKGPHPELLWFKLSRHETALFYMLLTKINTL